MQTVIGNLDQWVSGDRLGAFRSARRTAIALVLAVATSASIFLPEARLRGAWFPSALLVGLAAIYAFANTLYFEWYSPPVSVMLLLALMIGTSVLASAAQTRLVDRGRPHLARAVGIGGDVLLALWLGTVSLAPLRIAV